MGAASSPPWSWPTSSPEARCSTFLMWLLAELFETLPGSATDKPTMVFFADRPTCCSPCLKGRLWRPWCARCVSSAQGCGHRLHHPVAPTDVPTRSWPPRQPGPARPARPLTDAASLQRRRSPAFPVSQSTSTGCSRRWEPAQAVVSVLDEGRPAPAPVVINVPAAVMGPAQVGTVNQVLASLTAQAQVRHG